MKRFADRSTAGKALAVAMEDRVLPKDAIVFALPRGGVPVAFEIAQHFHLSCEPFLVRKLGMPGYEEFAFGAIASGDTLYLNEDTIKNSGLSPERIQQVITKEKTELQRRERVYRQTRFPHCEGKVVIIVDDGIATGATMIVACRALKRLNPARIIIATPVAPSTTRSELEQEADEVVVLESARDFIAIGQFYENFNQLSDQEVLGYLSRQTN